MDVNNFINATCRSLNVNSISPIEEIQSLWSGYGKILRYRLNGNNPNKTVVIKHVAPPKEEHRKQTWDNDISHQRKLKSYQVEMAWYRKYSSSCDQHCRVPQSFLIEENDGEIWMVMEDLDATGYSLRKRYVQSDDRNACLKWLAHFHAKFMHRECHDLWQQGCYWHLQTRPDELEVLDDIALKEAAIAINNKLAQAKHKTLVHGDAKLANFCFSNDGSVAAVDFQYVGGGCGMKDVAYLAGSCLNEAECEKLELEVLNTYFSYLKNALIKYQHKIDFDELEHEWRILYPYAWADFHRFFKGWSPGHWKTNSYSEKITRRVIKELEHTNISNPL